MQNLEEKIQGYLSGKLSEDERQEVKNWANASEQNAKLLAQHRKLYELSELDTSSFCPNVEMAWLKVEKKIAKHSIALNSGNVFYKIAAAIAVTIGLVFFSISYFSSPDLVAVNTREGEVLSVILSDSTSITLNENSTLKYPEAFDGSERKVYLDGQAFFEVKRDEDHPFKIIGRSSVTKVLGTSFDLIAKQTYSQVNVLSGSVSFKGRKSNDKVVLEKNNSATIVDAKLESFEHIDTKTLVWRLGELNFQSTPLREVAQVLTKHYGVEIQLQSGIDSCLITSKFEGKTMSEILEVLKVIANITNVSDDEKVVVLSGPSC